jgi:hypothetical protein
MNEARLRVGIGALALVGVGLSSYLLYVRWAGATLACSTGGCETVQASSYSQVLGIPVALLGLGAYATIFLCSLFQNDVVRAAAFSTAPAGGGLRGVSRVRAAGGDRRGVRMVPCERLATDSGRGAHAVAAARGGTTSLSRSRGERAETAASAA